MVTIVSLWLAICLSAVILRMETADFVDVMKRALVRRYYLIPCSSIINNKFGG